MKKILLGISLCLVALGIAAAPALAASPQHGHHAAKAGAAHAKARLVLNITARITNDEDSGMVGYWALDNYTKHVQVWRQANGSFYAVVRYVGKWQTFAGALSPDKGTVQGADASGTFHGGYTATFTDTVDNGPAHGLRAHGYVGTHDLGGTKADILLGVYSSSSSGSTVQAGTPSSWNWFTTYFPGATRFTETNWGWTYRYQNQTWVNSLAGTSGDIVVPAPAS